MSQGNPVKLASLAKWLSVCLQTKSGSGCEFVRPASSTSQDIINPLGTTIYFYS